MGLALLQDVVFLHQLSERHVIPVQQLVNVGGGVQVKLPKHGGRRDGAHSPGPQQQSEEKGKEEGKTEPSSSQNNKRKKQGREESWVGGEGSRGQGWM